MCRWYNIYSFMLHINFNENRFDVSHLVIWRGLELMSKFWKKVIECEHEWSPNYNPYVYCTTLGCYAWENHCLKCGVYEFGCKCGDSGSGQSGWSNKRWVNFRRKTFEPGRYPNIEHY
jgi:hypothetical protein